MVLTRWLLKITEPPQNHSALNINEVTPDSDCHEYSLNYVIGIHL